MAASNDQAFVDRVQRPRRVAEASPQLEGKGSVYCEGCEIAQVAEEAAGSGGRPSAIAPAFADELCAGREAWTGVPFQPQISSLF